MKKLIIVLFLIAFTGVLSAQSKWDGFFKPVEKGTTAFKYGMAQGVSEWKFRPAVTISAFQLAYNKETKKFDASSLTSGGIGVSYSHYTDVNGELYNNVGINVIALLNFVPTETTTAGFGVVTTVTAFEYFNVGGGYDITNKKWLILTGIKLGFN